jgi:hypothetical protein
VLIPPPTPVYTLACEPLASPSEERTLTRALEALRGLAAAVIVTKVSVSARRRYVEFITEVGTVLVWLEGPLASTGSPIADVVRAQVRPR